MFNIDIINVQQETHSAERVRNERLSAWKRLTSGFVSPFFRDNETVEDDESASGHNYNPENNAYAYVKFMVAQSAYNAPRLRLKSRTYGVDQAITELQYGINQLVQDRDYDEFLLGPVTDAMFARGISLTTLEDHPYIKGGKTTVKTRISPWHYARDPAALSPNTARYQFHSYKVDKDSLVAQAKEEGEDAGWIIQNVEALAEGSGVDDFDRRAENPPDIPDRGEVVVYQMWIRENEIRYGKGEGLPEDEELGSLEHPGPDSGHHGWLLTYGVTQGDAEGNGREASYLKDPEPYYGPPDGPYAVCEIHFVPDDPYGLAPLIAQEGANRDWNRHARGSSRSAANYKRLVLVDNTDPDFSEKVESGDHDLVIPIEGLGKDKVIQIEVGGITEQNLAYLTLCQERWERISGLGESQRGQATGTKTATAEAIADENSDIGVDFIKGRVHAFVRADLKKDLWYMWKDKDFRLVLGTEAAKDLGVATMEDVIGPELAAEMSRSMGDAKKLQRLAKRIPEEQQETIQALRAEDMLLSPGEYFEFKGGSTGVDFSTLALEIEPMSMERTTEGMAQRRALEMFQIVQNVAIAMPQMPHIRWEELLDKLGDAMNIPDLSTLIDMEAVPPPPPAQPSGSSPIKGPSPVSKQPAPSQGSPGNQTGGQLSALAGAQ